MAGGRSESERRDAALAHAGEVERVVGAVRPRELRQMLSLRIDGDLAAQLRELATERGVSVSDLLREAAGALVDRYRRKTVRLSVHTDESYSTNYTRDIATRYTLSYWDEGSQEAHHSGEATLATSGQTIEYA